MSCKAEFTITWVIENFKFYPQNNGECIRSTNLHLKQFHNTAWYLKLFPAGDIPSAADYVSCYLYRMNDDGPENIELEYILSINGSKFKILPRCFTKNSAFGFRTFMSRKLMKKAYLCTVECHMQMTLDGVAARDITEESTHYLTPCFLKMKSMIPEFMKETVEEIEQETKIIQNTLRLYSDQSVIRTRVLIEKRIVTSAIKDYLHPGSKRKQHILVPLPSTTIIFSLFMNTTDEGDSFEIEIRVNNEHESNCMLICKIELINTDRNIHFTSTKEHLFEKDKKIWNFGQLFKWNDVKENKGASLRFTLTFSDGQYLSDIDWKTSMEDSIGFLNSPNDVCKDLHRLFTEKRFCDVTIRVQNKSHDAHKTVLCSRSPVFAAMFENEMKENNTNVIEIDDLDSNTVNQMLNYMYTGIIEELNAERAKQLFVAADKYQMESLRDNCRCFLQNNLTLQNICSILLLADAHQDQKLLEYCIAFVSYHRKNLVESDEWKELKENNVFLALEILTKLCMKVFP